MNLGFTLNDLFEMSKVEEGDEPVILSKTGTINLSDRHKLHTQSYNYGETGVAYSEDGETLLACPASRPGTVRIHEGVKAIGNNAFYEGALNAIVLPDSLENIGSYAFGGSNLEKITFGKGLSTLGDENNSDIFSGCYNLTSVTIPDNIAKIGDGIFSSCKNLRTVMLPDTMTSIGRRAFEGCIFDNIVLPQNIKYVGDKAFYYTKSIILKKIPRNLIKAISLTITDEEYIDSYIVYDDDVRQYIKNYVEVSYNGTKMFIPRLIHSDKIQRLNNEFDEKWFTSKSGRCLFTYGATSAIKQDTAFAEYQYHKTSDAFSYIRKTGKKMAKRYLLEKSEEEFVELLRTGAIHRNALPELLSIANKEEKTIAAAYLMHSMEEQDSIASANLADDTFSL